MAKKILIVEDDNNFRKMVARKLYSIGYDTEEAVDGKDAIDKIKSNDDIDLIVLDMRMPRMNGFEFIEWVREHDCQIPVIITTQIDIREMDECDVYAVLEKPFDWDEFYGKVESAISFKENKDEIVLKIRKLRGQIDRAFNLTAAHM